MYGSRSVCSRRPARINIKALVILMSVTFLLGVGAVVGHYVRKRMTANEALELGQAAVEAEAWNDACRYLKQYLRKYPDDVPVLQQYADASLAVRPRSANSVGSAIGALRRLLRHAPGDAVHCKQLASLYFGARNYVDAAYICRERLKVENADADALLWLGRSLVAQLKNKEAREVLERLVRLHPDQVKAFALLGTIEIKQSAAAGVARAEEWLTQAVEANPKSAEALVRRAKFFRVLARNFDAAKADLESAADLLGDDPRVHLLLADEWIEWEAFDEASRYVKSVGQVKPETLARLEIDPEVLAFAKFTSHSNLKLRNPDARDHSTLATEALAELNAGFRVRFLPIAARLFLAGSNLEDAEKCVNEYGQAIDSRSAGAARSEDFVVLKAHLAVAKGKPYEAINLLVGSGGESPRSADAIRFAAEIFESTGQRGRARESLLQLVDRLPQDREAWIRLAEGFRRDDWDRAFSAAGTAWRLRPTLGAKLLLLEARLMRVLGESDSSFVAGEVRAELETLRDQFPKNAAIRVLMAIVDVELGQVATAISDLEKAVNECEDVVSAELLLVELYVRNGQTERARALCGKLIETNPDLGMPRIRMAELYLKASEVDEARRAYRAAIDDLSGSEQLRVARAFLRFLLTHEQRDSAIDLLRSMAKSHGVDVEILLTLFSIPEVRSDQTEAQVLIDRIREIEGDGGVRWKLVQAAFWLETEQWRTKERETRDLLDECVLADPSWEEPALVLGNLHLALGELREAEKTYRLALAHKRGAFGVADRLVGLLKREGRYIEAQEVLDTMPQASTALAAHRIDLAIGRGEYDDAMQGLQLFVATHPGDVPARIRLARLTYVVKRDHVGAMKLLDEASKLSPDSVDVLFARVSILQAQGLANEAIDLLNNEVDRLDNFAIYWLRATYYMAVGQFDLAEQDYVHLATFEDSAPAAYGLLGNFYHKRGRSDEAIAKWEEGLRQDPENVTLLRALTKGLVSSEDPALRERGRMMLADLQDHFSDDPELLYVEASLLFEERSSQSRAKAVERLERAVKLNPAFVSSHMVLIRLAREDGDHTLARKLVSRALAANPTHLGLRVAQINVELDLGKVGVARQLSRAMLDDRRDDLAVCNQLSDIFRRAGQYRDATTFNDEALRIAPGDAFANVTRTAILVAQGKNNEAREHLEAYVQTDAGRGNVAALLALASQHTAQADFASADKVLEQAKSLVPDGIGVVVERLRWFGAQDRFDDIMDLLGRTPADSREHVPILMAGANILSLSDRDEYLKEARAAFQRIRALDATNIPACFGFAEATSRLGDTDGAIAALRQVLQLDPLNRAALNNLGWMLATERGTSGLTEAQELIERALAQYPNDLHLLDTSGVVYQKLGRLAKAREQFERCLSTLDAEHSTRAKVLLHLSEVLIQLKVDADLIRPHLQEARDLHQQHQVFSEDEQRKLSRMLQSI